MSTTARLSIGEFSRLTWLSPKALRLYERRGLLLPDLVDEYTGYRYYRPAQAGRARTITLLRRVGMPLEQISAVLDAPDEQQSALITAYKINATQEHERSMALLDSIARGISSEDEPSGDLPVVGSRAVEPWAFVARTFRTTAADLPVHIERTTAALVDRAGASYNTTLPLVVAYHGEVGWESDGPVEVRVPVNDDAVADGTEPGGLELYVDVPFDQVQFPTILRSFDALREAATRGARHPVGPPREIYSDGDPFRCQVAQRYLRAHAQTAGRAAERCRMDP
ncbi:MerR family transcriptional regulator [Janibacter indicus]|uniref:MerR family transcriptional regulator n=1 Tax=Janibacter indicus TaxID=857417 RepID=UPI003EB962D8